jgi:hypothetical protein
MTHTALGNEARMHGHMMANAFDAAKDGTHTCTT